MIYNVNNKSDDCWLIENVKCKRASSFVSMLCHFLKNMFLVKQLQLLELSNFLFKFSISLSYFGIAKEAIIVFYSLQTL